MAIVPLPLEEVRDDRASPLPQDPRPVGVQISPTQPAAGDADASETARWSDLPADGADGAILQSAQGADAEAEAHRDATAPTVEPVAVALAPTNGAAVADASQPAEPVVPPIETSQAIGASGPAFADPASHTQAPPPETSVEVTDPAQGLVPEPPAVPQDEGNQNAGQTTSPAPAPMHANGVPANRVPLTSALNAAIKLAADANAAAEALENLKRLLERDAPATAGERQPVAAAAPQPASTLATARAVARASGKAALRPGRPVQPLIALPAAPRERRRLDVRGFLAGVAMSLAVGALLYLLLTAG
jgi:hypothetical protein